MSERPTDRLRAWYAGLGPRDQRVATWGALAAVVLLVGGVLLQLHAVVDRAAERAERKRADAAYIRSVATELRAAPVPQAGGQSLVVVVDRTTRDSGLAMHLRGVEPAGINSVRVRLEGAPFDPVVTWVLRLQREYGAQIQAASFERAGTGTVNASVTVARP